MESVSTVDLVLLVLALACFIGAAVGVAVSRVNLVALGLALVTLSLLLA